MFNMSLYREKHEKSSCLKLQGLQLGHVLLWVLDSILCNPHPENKSKDKKEQFAMVYYRL